MKDKIKTKFTRQYNQKGVTEPFSFSVSKNFEEKFLQPFKQGTELSVVDFLQADRTEYVNADGNEMVEYKFPNIDDEKRQSMEALALVMISFFMPDYNKLIDPDITN